MMMKAVKGLLLLVIAGSLALTGFTLTKVIGVQRTICQKQASLLKGVERQNDSIVDISGAFKPTEEMVGKTEKMLSDLTSLTSVVQDMNGLVAQANSLQATTDGLLKASNDKIGGLTAAAGAAKAPLDEVRARTAVTQEFINKTVAALQRMAGGLASTNGSAADIANMMEGKF
jgi:hypothetical protein